MRRWSVPSTIATSLLALAAAGPAAASGDFPAAASGNAFERLLGTLAATGWHAESVTAGGLRQACGEDLVCAAGVIADSDGRARLEPARHPDSDTIRWAKTRPSVFDLGLAPDGRRRIALDRFGRKVEAELRGILVPDGDGLILDLRANRGGDFERMLRVAGQFTGPIHQALFLVERDDSRALDLPDRGAAPINGPLTILVGPETASSGEVLAALLRRYAGARVLGARTAGKDYLLRIVPLDQDWRLLVPGETIEVPGERLRGGLEPDGPINQEIPS